MDTIQGTRGIFSHITTSLSLLAIGGVVAFRLLPALAKQKKHQHDRRLQKFYDKYGLSPMGFAPLPEDICQSVSDEGGMFARWEAIASHLPAINKSGLLGHRVRELKKYNEELEAALATISTLDEKKLRRLYVLLGQILMSYLNGHKVEWGIAPSSPLPTLHLPSPSPSLLPNKSPPSLHLSPIPIPIPIQQLPPTSAPPPTAPAAPNAPATATTATATTVNAGSPSSTSSSTVSSTSSSMASSPNAMAGFASEHGIMVRTLTHNNNSDENEEDKVKELMMTTTTTAASPSSIQQEEEEEEEESMNSRGSSGDSSSGNGGSERKKTLTEKSEAEMEMEEGEDGIAVSVPVVPPSLARPWVAVCERLGLAPVLVAEGLDLWNWVVRPEVEFSPNKKLLPTDFTSVSTVTGMLSEINFHTIPLCIELRVQTAGERDGLLWSLCQFDSTWEEPAVISLLKTLTTLLVEFKELMRSTSELVGVQQFLQYRHLLHGYYPDGVIFRGVPLPSEPSRLWRPSAKGEFVSLCKGSSAGQHTIFVILDLLLGIPHSKQHAGCTAFGPVPGVQRPSMVCPRLQSHTHTHTQLGSTAGCPHLTSANGISSSHNNNNRISSNNYGSHPPLTSLTAEFPGNQSGHGGGRCLCSTCSIRPRICGEEGIGERMPMPREEGVGGGGGAEEEETFGDFQREMVESYMPPKHKQLVIDVEARMRRTGTIKTYVKARKHNTQLRRAFDDCIGALSAVRLVHLKVAAHFLRGYTQGTGNSSFHTMLTQALLRTKAAAKDSAK